MTHDIVARTTVGRPTKLLPRQQQELVALFDSGRYDVQEIGRRFAVSGATVRRVVRRADRETLGLDRHLS